MDEDSPKRSASKKDSAAETPASRSNGRIISSMNRVQRPEETASARHGHLQQTPRFISQYSDPYQPTQRYCVPYGKLRLKHYHCAWKTHEHGAANVGPITFCWAA